MNIRSEKILEMKKEGKTLQEIGDYFNISGERVRQLGKKIPTFENFKHKLKYPAYSFTCPGCTKLISIPQSNNRSKRKQCSRECWIKSLPIGLSRMSIKDRRKSERKRMRKYYTTSSGKKSIERSKKKSHDPQKRRCYASIQYYLKTGKLIKPDYCADCERHTDEFARLEAHHEDYSKPLDVVWLCTPCHHQADKRLKLKDKKGV